MNESSIMFTYYLTLGVIVNDQDMSGEKKYEFGYVIIAFILLNILLNFIIFLASLIQQLIVKLKLFCLKFKKKDEPAKIAVSIEPFKYIENFEMIQNTKKDKIMSFNGTKI